MSVLRSDFQVFFPRLFKTGGAGRSKKMDPWIISTMVLGSALVIVFVMFALAIFRIHRMQKQLGTRPPDGAYPVVKGAREGMQVVAVWEGGNATNQHWRSSSPNNDQVRLALSLRLFQQTNRYADELNDMQVPSVR
jgi:hypothetical protein